MRSLFLGEHRSPARRRSWRTYYYLHAEKIKEDSRKRFWKNHAHNLETKAKYRRKQWRNIWGHRRVSDAEWEDVRRHYKTERALRNSYTFRELAALFRISPRRIQRRSSRDGGWALRATPERHGERP